MFLGNRRVSQGFRTPVMRSLDLAFLLNIFPAVRLPADFSFLSDRPS